MFVGHVNIHYVATLRSRLLLERGDILHVTLLILLPLTAFHHVGLCSPSVLCTE